MLSPMLMSHHHATPQTLEPQPQPLDFSVGNKLATALQQRRLHHHFQLHNSSNSETSASEDEPPPDSPLTADAGGWLGEELQHWRSSNAAIMMDVDKAALAARLGLRTGTPHRGSSNPPISIEHHPWLWVFVWLCRTLYVS
ncbi:uncharacterized protein LOC120351664 [Nilaparvata lugens]|uniref:uncharacterized protein LOC120351664 n=1 Tax=Nilaparvata lugens TaxID=108931 RepID=UPI00193D21FA|nr:uncharacterized protein LOC120351664 [Nilaparvata lugens]